MQIRYPLATAVVLLLAASQSWAFSLRIDIVSDYFDEPANRLEREHFPVLDGKSPTHQELTAKLFSDCSTEGSPCVLLRDKAEISRGSVVDGVRWNDFPAIYLTHQRTPGCNDRTLRLTAPKTTRWDVVCYINSLGYAWLNKNRFGDALWASDRPIVSRGHFGDLQFWHAMAPAGQTAGQTYDNIQMWMEFAFRVSLGEFDLNEDITKVPVPGLAKFFQPGARKVGDLVDYRYNKQKSLAEGVALGQILHIAQDSFAKCHAQRNENGQIERFFNYAIEDGDKHAFFDENPDQVKQATSGKLRPEDFGRELILLRANATDWETSKVAFRQLVQTYFRPVNPYLLSGASSECRPGRVATAG